MATYYYTAVQPNLKLLGTGKALNQGVIPFEKVKKTTAGIEMMGIYVYLVSDPANRSFYLQDNNRKIQLTFNLSYTKGLEVLLNYSKDKSGVKKPTASSTKAFSIFLDILPDIFKACKSEVKKCFTDAKYLELGFADQANWFILMVGSLARLTAKKDNTLIDCHNELDILPIEKTIWIDALQKTVDAHNEALPTNNAHLTKDAFLKSSDFKELTIVSQAPKKELIQIIEGLTGNPDHSTLKVIEQVAYPKVTDYATKKQLSDFIIHDLGITEYDLDGKTIKVSAKISRAILEQIYESEIPS